MIFFSFSGARFQRYLYKYWKLEAAVIALGLISLPLSLVNPYLAKLIIDKAYPNKDFKLFLILVIISGLIFIFNGIITSLNSYLSQRINISVHFDLAKDLFRHLQGLSLSFFNNQTTAEHLYKLSSDVNSTSIFISNTLPQIITLLPRSLFILAIVFYLNWKLALFAILLAPITYIHPYFLGKWLKEMNRRMVEKSQGLFKYLHEVFSHIYLVKALGKEDDEIKRFQGNLSGIRDLEVKNAKLTSISSFSGSLLNKTIGGLIVFYGVYQLSRGALSLGTLTALTIYLAQLIAAIEAIAKFYENITINSVSCQRIAETLDISPQIKDKPGVRDYPLLQGKIEFKGVCFGYQEDKFVLKDIDCSIPANAKIALVGQSGCGKTTLLALILRIYQLKEGAILIDGVDISDTKLEYLKAQVGIALQESFLWNDSIKNNILYPKENASLAEVMQAARLAQADDFITALPNGYDTIIGENACKISEGQKQRIAIARAIIKKPKILILDEAMSSLDSETEDKIVKNIKSAFGDSTVILVSHRLSTVKKMDLIYFLKSPFQIESASHTELIEKSSKYRELFASQLGFNDA